MHEHVGYKLINVEMGRLEEVQSKDCCEVYAHRLNNHRYEKHDNVDDEQVFRDLWDISHYTLFKGFNRSLSYLPQQPFRLPVRLMRMFNSAKVLKNPLFRLKNAIQTTFLWYFLHFF